MSTVPALPCNLDVERVVLGSVLLDDSLFPDSLTLDHFSTEAHRRILRAMITLRERGEKIDRVTVASELERRGERESTGGLSYLVSLDDGLPQLPAIDSYLRLLADAAGRRRILWSCQHLSKRAACGSESLEDILASANELFTSTAAAGQACRSIEDVPSVVECGATAIEYIREPELPRGAVVGVTGDAGCGKSTLVTAWLRDAWRDKGVAGLVLDRENPAAVVADRLARLGTADGPGLRLWGGWLSTEAPAPDAPIVSRWVASCDPHPVVVIDSLTAFLGASDQNDAGEMRAFLHRCRRIADLGATVVVLHHCGKSESSADYRGSSDFPAALDVAFHLTSFPRDGKLDRLVLRPFKSRFGVAGELLYNYAGGRFVRGDEHDARDTVEDQLSAILRQHPGATTRQVDDLANRCGLGRSRARAWLADGVLSGSIRRDRGPGNTWRYSLEAGHAD